MCDGAESGVESSAVCASQADGETVREVTCARVEKRKGVVALVATREAS